MTEKCFKLDQETGNLAPDSGQKPGILAPPGVPGIWEPARQEPGNSQIWYPEFQISENPESGNSGNPEIWESGKSGNSADPEIRRKKSPGNLSRKTADAVTPFKCLEIPKSSQFMKMSRKRRNRRKVQKSAKSTKKRLRPSPPSNVQK